MFTLGIDIGGSSIKGAVINTATGEVETARHKILTPQPATPEAIAKTVADIIKHFNWNGPVGCGFPAVVKNNIVFTATNIHETWIGINIKELFAKFIKNNVFFLNDADAAGIAEVQFGAGKDVKGTVIMITVGTGVGTAIFIDSNLVPNTELGRIMVKGQEAESFISDKTRKKEELTWKDWAKRFDKYLFRMDFLFSPSLFILSGGASNKWDKFNKYLTIETKITPAQSLNYAGIIGSAVFASKCNIN